VPEKSGHERSEGSPKHDEFPSAQILKVSKIIHAEAITFLYSHNTFTNVSVEDKDHIYDFLEDPRDFQSGFSRYWKAHRPTAQRNLVDAIGRLFELYAQKLPVWLLGSNGPQDRTFQNTKNWINDSYRTGRCIEGYEYDDGGGFDFPRFLRQIGQLNAAKIRTLQLTFGDLPRAVDHLPLYAEILKQHVTGLQNLVVGKTS